MPRGARVAGLFAVVAAFIGASCADGAVLRVPQEYPSVALAANLAQNGDVILVSPGTYGDPINVGFRVLTIRSTDGPGVTTLAPISVRSLSISGPSVVTLEGFTLTHGAVPTNGGVSITGGSLAVSNCVFSSCFAGGSGGAIGADGGSGTSITVTDCVFTGNTAQSSGGAIRCIFGVTLVVNRCRFVGNTAGLMGGAIDGTIVRVSNSVFAGNSAPSGGAISTSPGNVIVNCTFTGNSITTGSGRCIWATPGGGTLTVQNCIMWGNTGGMGTPAEVAVAAPGTAAVTYSDVQGGFAGAGNANTDPMFVDAAAGNYRLRAGSPCVDAGSNVLALAAPGRDADDLARFVDDPGAANTGVGGGGQAIVDMGAYERGIGIVGGCAADFNQSGTVTVQDIFGFLTAWFAGCP